MAGQEGNPEERLDLSRFLREVGENLLCEPSSDADALASVFDDVLSDIRGIHSQYEVSAPEGAQSVREFMRAALDLYVQCLDEMRDFLSDNEESHIYRGLEKAEEADDILLAVETVILDSKELLNLDRRA